MFYRYAEDMPARIVGIGEKREDLVGRHPANVAGVAGMAGRQRAPGFLHGQVMTRKPFMAKYTAVLSARS